MVQCEASSDWIIVVVASIAIDEGSKDGSKYANRVMDAASTSAKPAVCTITNSIAGQALFLQHQQQQFFSHNKSATTTHT
jgi:hypothetical protein